MLLQGLYPKSGVFGGRTLTPRRQPSFGEYGRPGSGGRPFGDPDREHAQMGLVAPHAAPRSAALIPDFEEKVQARFAARRCRSGSRRVCRRNRRGTSLRDEPSARICGQAEHSRSCGPKWASSRLAA
ncbi:MAG: hypothetical protein ACLR8Y_05525 [Alistipes indistinctus]